MAARKVFKVTLDSDTFSFYAADVYTGDENTIGQAVGITEAANDVKYVFPAGALVTAGILERLAIKYRGSTGPAKSANIYCAADKVRSAIGDLPGKKYKNIDVTSANKPRQTTLG